jgi:hypothetical protein
MKNYALQLIFILSLLTNSCDNGKIVSPDDNQYILLEIKRHTDGIALSDSCGNVYIDFAGYQYEEQSGKLYITIILDRNFHTDNPFSVICAMERSLGGDLGEGFAGGVFPIDEVPTAIPIMTFPLPGQDSVTINNIYSNGAIELLFKNKQMKIQAKTVNIAEQNIQDTATIFGRFNIQDQITIINRGFLNREKIIWP